MAPHELPRPVDAFITTHLRSLEQFEVLVLVARMDERWWDADAVADQIGIAEPDARRALDHLAARNLLEIRITGDVRYRFQPGAEKLREDVRDLLQAYRTSRAAVLSRVAGARRGLRDFADAFRIGRHDDDR
jgi:predicted ArsR family transcriptional regulator